MAILSARSVDSLRQESVGFLSDEQLRRLTKRLNRKDGEALSAEWELIVLTALSYVGVIEHEPLFAGSRKLDFRFDQPATGTTIIGDITSLCDDEVQKNSVDYLSNEMSRRLGRQGIQGRTMISVECETADNGSLRPCLPDPHEFKRYIFNAEFLAFAKNIIAKPGGTHTLQIDSPKARLSITFSPGEWTTMMSYRNFQMPRDITNNIIHHAIQRKHDQIKGSRHPDGDGWRCVVLCDGNCGALTGRKDWATHSAGDIITRYLRDHHSLDFVVCVSVQRHPGLGSDIEFTVEAFDGPNCRVADTIRQLFKEGLERIPHPVRTAVNAKYYIERRAGTQAFSDGRIGTSYGGHEFTFSSRNLLDYISGRIDRTTFLTLVNQHPVDILKRRLDEGSLPVELKLVRREQEDDDAVVIKLGPPDPAVSGFPL